MEAEAWRQDWQSHGRILKSAKLFRSSGCGHPPRARNTPSKPARVLVVDDEAQVRSMIAATLERQGYEVELAAGGREALDALEHGAPSSWCSPTS